VSGRRTGRLDLRGDGNDTLRGAGGNDRITDVAGTKLPDRRRGRRRVRQPHHDPGPDGRPPADTVSGNAGFDRAQIDEGEDGDENASIEQFLA
jgi:Ca2+-binding RTX toxin-like protein